MKKKLFIVFIMIICFLFLPFSSIKAAEDIGKIKDIFPDINLRNEIKLIFGKKDDDFITKEEAAEIDFLFLKDKNIENIAGIEVFTNLKSLNLVNNNIIKVSDNISKLENLQYLYLDDNKIESITKEIGKLISLKELSISKNNLENLPEEIGDLADLRKIDISENSITELPVSIKSLSNIEVILAYKNLISFLPEEIGLLKNLIILDLNNNKLISLDQSLADLDNLYFIDLGNNSIFNIDLKAYNKVTGLKGYFNLSNQNKIVQLTSKGLKGKDYAFPAFEILKLDLGYKGEYYLISPDDKKEKITVNINKDNFVIPGEYLNEKGDYKLEIHVLDSNFNTFGSTLNGQKGSIYKVLFSTGNISSLPSNSINKYLLISVGVFAVGILVLTAARLFRKKN